MAVGCVAVIVSLARIFISRVVARVCAVALIGGIASPLIGVAVRIGYASVSAVPRAVLIVGFGDRAAVVIRFIVFLLVSVLCVGVRESIRVSFGGIKARRAVGIGDHVSSFLRLGLCDGDDLFLIAL